MKNKSIFIATSTFAVHSNEPIKKLEDRGEAIALNPLFRKVTSEELKRPNSVF